MAIVFCVEQGVLEQQARLLVASMQTVFASGDYTAYAYAPRTDSRPSLETQAFLKDHGVELILEPLNTDFLAYPIANKVLACRHIESTQSEYQSIVFVDTDTLFLNAIDTQLLASESALYLRPVDNKGPGSTGKDDEKDAFWQKVFALFGLTAPEPVVMTTVRPHLIRNYFNAGLIWAHRLPGFFQQWHDDFMVLVESQLRPFFYQSRDGNDFRCLDQVALAVTATRYQAQLRVLPQTYNYPVPFRPMMRDRAGHPSFQELTHIHYHKWFQHPGFLDHVTSDEDKLSSQYQWLKSHVPITPYIDDSYKC